MKSPAPVSFGLVEAGLIRTTLRDWTSGASARVTPLHTAPSTATGGFALAMIVLNAKTPSAGLHRSSSTTTARLRPRMPPATLIVHGQFRPGPSRNSPVRRFSGQWQHCADGDRIALGCTEDCIPAQDATRTRETSDPKDKRRDLGHHIALTLLRS